MNPTMCYDVQDAIRMILRYIGEDVNREGLRETPNRVMRSFSELCSGYLQDPKSILKTFEEGACDEMVVLKVIETVSLCEHHMLPFLCTVHVGYIPTDRIVGISKLARLVEVFSRRLQVQERLTTQITQALDEVLQPKGSACVIHAKHLCLCMRGVKKQNSVMITSSLTGAFKESASTRSEFLDFIKG